MVTIPLCLVLFLANPRKSRFFVFVVLGNYILKVIKMLKQNEIAQPVKPSSRVQRRLKKRLIEPLEFAVIFGGVLSMKFTNGFYYCGFSSEEIKTHAWGSSFSKAYRNMLRHFHDKNTYLQSKISE